MNTSVKKIIVTLSVTSLIIMLWNYSNGYQNAISWNVTTTAEVIDFPAWKSDKGLMEHQIMGKMYLLKERYSGSEIRRNLIIDQILIGLMWGGLCLLLSLATTFNRYTFFGVMAGFALFINRLNLFEVGLFGIDSKLVMLVPFVMFLVPLVYFHEYNKSTSLILRLSVLIVLSAVLVLGVGDPKLFTDHFIAHSIFGFSIIALLYIFLVAEELVFLFLYAVTSTKGGKSNHLHFIFISLIYLSNLTLYYLNKSGIYQNSFFFFDPFILLAISSLVAIWSIRYKEQAFSNLIPQGMLRVVLSTLGIITFFFLSLSMVRGVEMVHQSFHYFILYAHLGFGVLFLLYILSNFLDPLIKGFEVFKIAYRERNFPYASARLGGLVVVAAFFFLSGQEAYNLLRSGYYAYLSDKTYNQGDELLGNEYLINSEFLGFNAHYPNYKLAWNEWEKGKDFRAKTNFFNATQRFPSSFAWVNYGNLEVNENPNKVKAVYEESLRREDSPEMKNNLGVIFLDSGEPTKALDYFQDLEASNAWNEAPLLNKWHALGKIGAVDSTNLNMEYNQGNYGVKSNIISSIQNENLSFQFDQLPNAAPLHRLAYLINSTYAFDHDSIEQYVRKEMQETLSSTTYHQLAQALALHLYKKGEVNKAFRLFDELQANTNEVYKGAYFDALGKLSLDQGAYLLAEEFFTKAIKAAYEAARVNRLEAYAALGKHELIANELIRILDKSPELTNLANDLLAQIEAFQPEEQKFEVPELTAFEIPELKSLAGANAFNEELVLATVEELVTRDSTSNGYELLVEAIEINPHSPLLQKSYILTAIDLNLLSYADQSMADLQELLSAEEYDAFSLEVEARKEASIAEGW